MVVRLGVSLVSSVKAVSCMAEHAVFRHVWVLADFELFPRDFGFTFLRVPHPASRSTTP
jgi:hypothetical protein